MCMYFYILADDSEVFVMSRCPDGQDGEATMAEVMQQVKHKVSLNFTYIATYLLLYIYLT
jgi:hypothetical protein